MSTPSPEPKKPLLVVPSGMSRRDIITAIIIAVAVIGFIAFSVFHVGTWQSGNLISGIVTGHSATGDRETLLDVSRKGVKSSTADTGYSLKVFVKKENRTYDVMVERDVWEKKKDGDTLEFLRPPSEQQ